MVLIVSAEDIEIVQILVVVARIAVGHLLILTADDEHHHYQEHIDEDLYAQQSQLPPAGVLRIVLQRGIDWNPFVQFGRDHDRDDEHEQDHEADGEDAPGHQQRLERHAQQVLDDTAAGENEGGSQCQRERDMQQRLLGQHPVNVLAFSAIAFPNTHFLGAFDQRRDDNQDIVQQRNQDQQRSDDRKQDDLCLHFPIACVQFAERLQEIRQGQTNLLQFL